MLQPFADKWVGLSAGGGGYISTLDVLSERDCCRSVGGWIIGCNRLVIRCVIKGM